MLVYQLYCTNSEQRQSRNLVTPAAITFLEEGNYPGTWRWCGPQGGWAQVGSGQSHHNSDGLCMMFVSKTPFFFV